MACDKPSEGITRDIVDALRRAYLATLLAGEPAEAELIIREAIDAGVGRAVIDEQIIAPSMRAVGRLWKEGSLSVGEEHLATEISFRVLALQREAFRTAGRRGASTVMLAAPQGERHVLGLNMTADLLAESGYDVRLLGADVPTASLAALVARHQPRVVCFTATMPEAAIALRDAVQEVLAVRPGTQLLLGGSSVPPALLHAQDVTVSSQLTRVVETVDALVARAHLN